LPKIHLWYIALHGSWVMNSQKIMDYGRVDYSSAQWIQACSKTARKWCELLELDWTKPINTDNSNDETNTGNIGCLRFGTPPIPLFMSENKDNNKINSNKSSKNQEDATNLCSHYMPLGIFQTYFDKQQNVINDIGKLALESHVLEEGKEVEFHLKRLIHESVSSIEELFPYLHTGLYKKDTNSDEFGWFPMEWIYAEVDIQGCSEDDFQHLYETYTTDNNNESSNLDQNESETDNHCKYNPFYMLRFPRIPLFVIEIKLPIDVLKRFADEIESKSPRELIATYNQRCSNASQYNNAYSNGSPAKTIEINRSSRPKKFEDENKQQFNPISQDQLNQEEEEEEENKTQQHYSDDNDNDYDHNHRDNYNENNNKFNNNYHQSSQNDDEHQMLNVQHDSNDENDNNDEQY